MHTYNVVACGLDLSFNSSADEQRVRNAIQLVQESYDGLRLHGNQLGKERLLAILAIGIADDLLQLQEERNQMTKATEEKNFKDEALQEKILNLLQMLNSSLDSYDINSVEKIHL